jgi:isopenicillin-N epimerase
VPDFLSESFVNPWRGEWALRQGVTYLNHGSFGPAPQIVVAAREKWSARLQREPMDFLVRQLEGALDATRERLAKFINTRSDHLAFVDNATVGMNVVARSVSLGLGDEVLLTDHEYGAVQRIWRRRCQETGATFTVCKLPQPIESVGQIVEALQDSMTPRTKLLVVSHVTSPTALILPVREICARAREQGISVCIDGPHAPAAVPIDLEALGCDYYAASCHKWLSAPFGSGFLYVHPRRQSELAPSIVSWGRSLSGRPGNWKDEFNWTGTRDPAPWLAIADAIAFLQKLSLSPRDDDVEGGNEVDSEPPQGVKLFREYSHQLASYARRKIVELTGLAPFLPDTQDWYGTMIALPLPEGVRPVTDGHMHPLQEALWEKHQIEVPIVTWRGSCYIRVSCHLYNDVADIDRLTSALRDLL